MKRALIPAWRAGLTGVLAFVGASVEAQQWCGGSGPESPCLLSSGEYHVWAPPHSQRDLRAPAVLIIHDSGSSGLDMITDENSIKPWVEEGHVVVAPSAKTALMLVDDQIERQSTWALSGIEMVGSIGAYSFARNRRLVRDDVKFISNVLDDATARFRIDRRRVLVIGIGSGASMTLDLACQLPHLATLFVAIGGGFFGSPERTCEIGANLLYIHEKTDEGWPLEGTRGGRKHGVNTYRKVSVSATVNVLAEANGCRRAGTQRNDEIGAVSESWSGCVRGSVTYFLFDDNDSLNAAASPIVSHAFAALQPKPCPEFPPAEATRKREGGPGARGSKSVQAPSSGEGTRLSSPGDAATGDCKEDASEVGGRAPFSPFQRAPGQD